MCAQAVRLLNSTTWQSLGTLPHQASIEERSHPGVVVYQQASLVLVSALPSHCA